MVHGFIIHTLGPGPLPCQVLYSRLFGRDVLEEKLRADEGYLQRERSRRMERVAVVARQAESACLLRRQTSGRSASDYASYSADEPVCLLDDDLGIFGLRSGDPFPQEMIVLWVAVRSLGFSLICDSLDNLSLAEFTLKALVRYLVDSLKLLTHSSHTILRADKIEMSLDKFIPQGHLLFLNHQAVQTLEKELNSAMTIGS